MKCPNCGESLKEDYLYCEQCGAEIHMVPDFEPEIENSIHRTLKGMVEAVVHEKSAETNQEENRYRDGERKRNGILLLMCGLFVLVLILVAIAGGIARYRYHSIEYQLKEALSYSEKGKEEEALTYYKRAVELQSKNASIRMRLALVYEKLGEDILYLEELKIVATADYSSEDEVEQAYKKIIQYYKEKEDYQAINELLKECKNENVVNANQSYMAKPPEFSFQTGTYAEVLPLKLTSSTKGNIYYTLDGSVPHTGSELYTSPIFLDTGDYIVSALFVNEYGISSDISTKKYTIDVIKPAPPDVQVYSGEYIYPVMITVDIYDGSTVYYTTDGTMPTDQSYRYTGPIPMPLGKSTYKFVMYNQEGVAGDITSREYELTLNTEFTFEDAVAKVIATMLERGKIYHEDGRNQETAGKYLYHFRHALAIPDYGDVYVITEIYEDSAGIQSKTGTDYAVNVYTGELYKLFKDEKGNYLLEVF